MHAGSKRAVVGLVDAAKTDVQGARRDVGRGAAGIRIEHIVAGVLSCQMARRHLIVDHFAAARILVAEAAQQACHAHLVARHQAFEIAGQGSVRRAVIHAAERAGDAVVQQARRDIGRGAAAARVQHIVARIHARQHHVGHADGLASSRVLVAERRTARHRQGVALDAVVADIHVGGNAAVIRLADATEIHVQGTRGDVGRGAAAVSVQHVVARIHAIERHVRHIDGFVHPCILVGKYRIARQRQGIALHAVIAKGDACGDTAVIGLADAVQTDVQGARRDVGRGAAAVSVQHIVARIRAAQCHARDIDGLAATRTLVAECRTACHGQGVATDPVIAKIHLCARRAVIGLVDATQADVQRARRDGRRAIGRRRGQAVIAQVIANQGQVAGMHGLVAARVPVEECCQAVDGNAVARHNIAQQETDTVVAQRAVIHLAIAADADRQHARRDGESGGAAQGDVVFGRPQPRQIVIAHVARATVAEAAIDARVAVEQADVADRPEEGGQLAIIDLAAGIAGHVHLQRLQQRLQHRRRIAFVNAPGAAEIKAVETALLLHLRGRAARRAPLLHHGAGRLIVKEGVGNNRARIGTPHQAARRTAGETVACHGAAAKDIAGTAARHAPADQAAHVFMGDGRVAAIGGAHRAGGVGIADGAAVASHQAADIRRAAHAARGVRLGNHPVVIAHQAADHGARARDGAAGRRRRDAGARPVQAHQATDAARVIGVQAGHRAAGIGSRDRPAIAADESAHIAPAADGGAAADVVDRATEHIAHQRAHVRHAGDAAAMQAQVAQGTVLQGAKQADGRIVGAAIDHQIADGKAGAIEDAGVSGATAGDGDKTLAAVPVHRAARVDIAGQAIAVAQAKTAGALQAVDIGKQVRRRRAAVTASGAQETGAAADGKAAGAQARQAGRVLHPVAAIQHKRAAHRHGASGRDGGA